MISAARIPTIFISSTCYDLSQVRTDLKLFIDGQLGFESLLSETSSFPLAPDLNAVDNCLRAVRERADIFILIIGGRYGSVLDDGKSITNLEYLQAKSKGIPVYVFIDKRIINILPVWRNNQNADFSSVVDSPKLFDFVELLRDKENVWIHGFETAQDIITIFKKQAGYLFYDCLNVYKKYTQKHVSKEIAELEAVPFKIAIEKQPLWEYKLFGEVLKSVVRNFDNVKKDFQYGLSFSNINRINDTAEVLNKIDEKSKEMLKIINEMTVLMNEALPIAVGAPGEEGDVEHIIYVAKRIGEGYGRLLSWGVSLNSIIVPDDCKNLMQTVAKLVNTPVRDIEDYCSKYDGAMTYASSFIGKEMDEVVHIDLTLKLNRPDFTEFEREMKILEKIYN